MIIEAVKNLTRLGWTVEKHGKKWIAVHSGKFLHDYRKSDCYSDRELIRLSRSVFQTSGGKKIAKRIQPKRLRRRIKQAIQLENFDNIRPDIRAKGKEDSWCYD